jgi:O-methyltransferase domain/Dimerisation domain
MSVSKQLDAAPDLPPQVAMLQMISGFWLARAIYIAAKLGLADLVKEQAKSAEELALETHTHGPSLYRVLRALASAGIFAEDEEQRFHSTPIAATLQSDTPGSLRYIAMTELGEEHYPAWENVLHSVKTGEIAFDHRFGMPIWEFFATHPENAQIFDNAMAHLTTSVNEAILSSYDFSPFSHVVDVAGGQGGFLIGLLKANPAARGLIYDLPHVIEKAKQSLNRERLEDRCEAIAGDIFQSVPAGGDAYVLKWIIHDWNDEQSVTILKNCRAAMTMDAKLLLIESVIPPGNEPAFAKFMDLNMLVMTGGRERSESQYRELLAAAGFALSRIVPTPSPFCVIEATRAE